MLSNSWRRRKELRALCWSKSLCSENNAVVPGLGISYWHVTTWQVPKTLREQMLSMRSLCLLPILSNIAIIVLLFGHLWSLSIVPTDKYGEEMPVNLWNIIKIWASACHRIGVGAMHDIIRDLRLILFIPSKPRLIAVQHTTIPKRTHMSRRCWCQETRN